MSDEQQAIIYEIRDSSNNLLLTVAVVGSKGNVTILGLPSGAQYTVILKNDWSWEYVPTTQKQTITFDGDETLNFEYKAGENSAITDDAYGA